MTNAFNANSTIDEVLENIDLSGQRVLITGASGGIGKETARAMADKGAEIILAARDASKLKQAADDIRKTTRNNNIDTLIVDLASQTSIRQAATECLERYDSINLLINNAGVMACPAMKTKEGIELQFGVCHIGHFLLTNLLNPALIRGAPARIINLSSGGHRIAPVEFDDINFEKRAYDKWVAYGQAKTANALFSVELDNRLQSQCVRAYAVHPGTIYDTDLARYMDKEDLQALAEKIPLDMQFKTLAQGAATTVWAATSKTLEELGGLYLEDCRIAQLNDNPETHSGYRSWALDALAAKQLWQLSEKMVGERFLH